MLRIRCGTDTVKLRDRQYSLDGRGHNRADDVCRVPGSALSLPGFFVPW